MTGSGRASVFVVNFGKWTGDRLGFFCFNDLKPQGHVDVDWFRYGYDGPKAGSTHKCTLP